MGPSTTMYRWRSSTWRARSPQKRGGCSIDILQKIGFAPAPSRTHPQGPMSMHRIDNPYTGDTVAERRFLEEHEVEGLVTRAFRAHKGWARTALSERIALCERFCQEFEKDAERIAREVTQQMGKPLGQARGEVKTALQRARVMMSLAPEALRDEPLPPVPGF